MSGTQNHLLVTILLFIDIKVAGYFYAPGLKGPSRASSNRIVRPSVCTPVCLSVRNSVQLTNKVQ